MEVLARFRRGLHDALLHPFDDLITNLLRCESLWDRVELVPWKWFDWWVVILTTNDIPTSTKE